MEVVVAGVVEVKQANDLVPVLLAVEVAHLDARLFIDKRIPFFVMSRELHVGKAADAPLSVL